MQLITANQLLVMYKELRGKYRRLKESLQDKEYEIARLRGLLNTDGIMDYYDRLRAENKGLRARISTLEREKKLAEDIEETYKDKNCFGCCPCSGCRDGRGFGCFRLMEEKAFSWKRVRYYDSDGYEAVRRVCVASYQPRVERDAWERLRILNESGGYSYSMAVCRGDFFIMRDG